MHQRVLIDEKRHLDYLIVGVSTWAARLCPAEMDSYDGSTKGWQV